MRRAERAGETRAPERGSAGRGARSRFPRRSLGAAPERAALLAERLAVLLGAGLSPVAAWRHLGEGADPATQRLAAEVAAGTPVATAVAAVAERAGGEAEIVWRALAASWQVATTAGAPLGPALRALGGALRNSAQIDRDARTALAGPRATARLVVALPFIAVAFGALLGFGTLEVLFREPLGIACLVVGALLLLLARRWLRAQVDAAISGRAMPGIALDLLAVALSGGGDATSAAAMVRAARERFGLVDAADDEAIDEALALSRRAGVPAAELLRAQAEESRRAARAENERRVEELGVAVMKPMGLCILPAFLVLGVVPVVVAVLRASLAPL